jgi:hypothetical protein
MTTPAKSPVAVPTARLMTMKLDRWETVSMTLTNRQAVILLHPPLFSTTLKRLVF